jgi:hypothetical protein
MELVGHVFYTIIEVNYDILVGVRFQGVSLPAIHVMLSKWAPPAERNRISSLAYAGNYPKPLIKSKFNLKIFAALGFVVRREKVNNRNNQRMNYPWIKFDYIPWNFVFESASMDV